MRPRLCSESRARSSGQHCNEQRVRVWRQQRIVDSEEVRGVSRERSCPNNATQNLGQVMSRRVLITGVGVVSSLGDSPAQLHDALCAGRNGLAPTQSLSANELNCHFAAGIESFRAEK